MLVLSRRKGESILIGDEVEVTIITIRGNKVGLGISAPSHVPVHRREASGTNGRPNPMAVRTREMAAVCG